MDARKYLIRCLLLLAAALAAAPAMSAPPGVGGPMKTRSVYIFPGPQGAGLLKQCSRKVPQDVSDYWTPTDEQVAALKSALELYLRQHSADGGDVLSHPLDTYHGQYVGIVSGGKRLIYGNFYIHRADWLHEDTQPVGVCDGGRSFFGVVFDPASNKIVDVAFNGEG
ncbi:MAG TPA: hypothetical protein VGH71_09140 [Gammaproteobacteria bacterium]|jgi:hypothetical protein